MISIRDLTPEEIKKNEFSLKQSLCAKRVTKLRNNATKAEQSIITQLKQTNIRYKFQKGFIEKSNFAIADFYFPDIKTVLEIDGGCHNTHKQKIRDEYRTKHLSSRGVKVIRLTNQEAFKVKPNDLYNILGLCSNVGRKTFFVGC